MKQLTCEVCGGNDLLKQDGVFVCQSCGCKYSADEVKKLMVEISAPVEIKGINTINDEIQNVYALIKIGKMDSARKVLKQLEQKAPRNPYVWLAHAAFVYNEIMVFDKSQKSIEQKSKECKKYIDCYFNNAVNYSNEKKQIKLKFDTYYSALSKANDSANNLLENKLSSINLAEYGCYEWNQWEDRYDRRFYFCSSGNSMYYITNDKMIECQYEYKHKWLNHYNGTYSDYTYAYFAHKIDNVDSRGNIKYSNDTYVFLCYQKARIKARIISNECIEVGEKNCSAVIYKYSGYEKFLNECTENEPVKIRLNQQNHLVVADKKEEEFPLRKHSDCGNWSRCAKLDFDFKNLPISSKKNKSTGER